MEDIKLPKLQTGKNADLRLTSCKIHEGLTDRLKTVFIKEKFNMQKLVNRSINLYINNVEFRNMINNHTDLVTSGSL